MRTIRLHSKRIKEVLTSYRQVANSFVRGANTKKKLSSVELAHACYENIIVQRQEKCDSQSFFTSLLVLFTVQRSKPELCSGLQIVRQ